MLRLVLVLLLASPAVAPAVAQPLTLLRQTAGDVAFEMRVDTTATCPDAPTRLFARTDDAVTDCGSGRGVAVVWRGRDVDVLDTPMAWLGAEPDTTVEAAVAAAGDTGGPWPVERPAPARDLTDDGVPDVILTTYSGGMHCCTTHWLVALAPDGPRTLARVEALDGQAEVADLDGDGTAEWTLPDFSFAYWNESFAGSPAPTVVLAWDGERLAASPEHMRRTQLPDLPSAADVRADDAWAATRFPPTAYWATLLDLLYAGRGAEAARFADEAWAGDAIGRTVFLRMLADRIWQSPYASAVAAMNADAVDWL